MDAFPMSGTGQYSLQSNDARLNIKNKSEPSNKKLRNDFLRSGTFGYKDFVDRIYINKQNWKDIINIIPAIYKMSKILGCSIHDLTALL